MNAHMTHTATRPSAWCTSDTAILKRGKIMGEKRKCDVVNDINENTGGKTDQRRLISQEDGNRTKV